MLDSNPLQTLPSNVPPRNGNVFRNCFFRKRRLHWSIQHRYSIVKYRAKSFFDIFANLSIRREEKANERESFITRPRGNEPSRGNLENDRTLPSPSRRPWKISRFFLFLFPFFLFSFFFFSPAPEGTTNGENRALNEPLRTITTKGEYQFARRHSSRFVTPRCSGIAGSPAIRKKKNAGRNTFRKKRWLSINRINPCPNSKREEEGRREGKPREIIHIRFHPPA